MFTTKSKTALLALLFFFVVAFSWNNYKACTDIIKNNIAPPDVNLKGFAIFNKTNFSVKKENFIVKGIQIVAVLKPNFVNTGATPPQITKSICFKTKKAFNALYKYIQTKAKTPTAALHKTQVTCLKNEHRSYTVLFDSNIHKISLNFKTNSYKIALLQNIKSKTLTKRFASNIWKKIPENSTKIFKLLMKPILYYGSSGFANRPRPET